MKKYISFLLLLLVSVLPLTQTFAHVEANGIEILVPYSLDQIVSFDSSVVLSSEFFEFNYSETFAGFASKNKLRNKSPPILKEDLNILALDKLLRCA